MAEITSPVYLYILMRTDLASMNPGKAVAQGAHAANQCIYEARNSGKEDLVTMVAEWEAETQKGFGTTITLAVKERELRNFVTIGKALGIHCGNTHDPTYPLRDGEFLHLIPLDTCGYFFGRKNELEIVLKGLELHP